LLFVCFACWLAVLLAGLLAGVLLFVMVRFGFGLV